MIQWLKERPKLVAVSLLVLLLLAFNRRAKWEYKIVSPRDSTFDITMNRFGKDGWEIVSARRASANKSSRMEYELILKRRK